MDDQGGTGGLFPSHFKNHHLYAVQTRPPHNCHLHISLGKHHICQSHRILLSCTIKEKGAAVIIFSMFLPLFSPLRFCRCSLSVPGLCHLPHSPKTRYQLPLLRLFSRDEPDPQLRLPPHDMHVALALPVEALVDHLKVVFEVELGEDEGHFQFSEASPFRSTLHPQGREVEKKGETRKGPNRGNNEQETYLRPRHPLGPNENGLLASFTSLQSGSIQRSGLKEKGSWKYSGLWVVVQALVYISDWRSREMVSM